MAKMKTGNLQGIQRHNQRETTNHSNKDIDISRSFLNYVFVHSQPINYQNTIKHIIDSQRISQRAVRKDAVLVDEWIITSDLTFFEDKSNIKEFFQDTVTYFADRCGQQNIAYAMVHLDETTPHMHLGIVPMIDGKLSSKAMFDRSALKNIQDELPQFLQDKGHHIERGLKGSEQKHLSVEEFKENKREIERMTQKIEQLHIESSSLGFETNLLNQSSHQLWHDDWQETLNEIPEFEMTYAVKNRLLEDAKFEFIHVDKDTPKTYNMTFWEVFSMMQEKFKLVKEYIAEKWQNLTHRESGLKNHINILERDKNRLEMKLEGLNSEVNIKQKENENLNTAINGKMDYIQTLTKNAELSMAMPDYVRVSKLNKDMLIVPKDKWRDKHVSANVVSDFSKLRTSISNIDRKIETNTIYDSNVYGLEQEVRRLNQQVHSLQGENTQYWNSLGDLLDSNVLSEDLAFKLDLPQSFKDDYLFDLNYSSPKQQSTKQKEIDGPTLSM